MTGRGWLRNGILLLSASSVFTAVPAWAAGPNVELAKQVLTRKWLQLRPDGVKERNVLFQEVRPAGGSNFVVTAIIRDYETGYPPNHYYGRTCVSRIEQWTYTLWNGSAGWDVDGRMTPDMSKVQCKPNPADGVSSQPLQGLPGTRA
jgi:hypothetical protein